MNFRSPFRQRRLLLPLASVMLLAGAAVLAVLRSDASRVIIYNQTGAPVAGLKVTACGQYAVFRNIAEEESFRWKLSSAGAASDIELESAIIPPWHWRGAYIQPRGGYRVTLRLWPDGEVEVHTQISLWQRLFHAAPSINE